MATITKCKWKTGKGEEREAWVLAYTDQAGKRHKEQFPRKKEADAKRIKVEGQVSTGAFRVEAKKKTVPDAIDAFIKHHCPRIYRAKNQLRKAGKADYRSAARPCID